MRSQPDYSVIMFPEEAPLPEPLMPRRDVLETRSGRRFDVRIARPLDLPALKLFLSRITPEDLRFRFLSPAKTVPDGLLQQLLGYDHVSAEHFLVLEPKGNEIIASAVVAGDRKSATAEIAICTRPDYKGLGLSWALLSYATQWAKGHGAYEAVAIEAMDHADAIKLEHEQGFRADPDQSCPGVQRLIKPLKGRSRRTDR